MNKLIGYLKLKSFISKNIDKNMAVMLTNENRECLGHRNRINVMEFINNYKELKEQIINMKDGEKKVFISMPKESNINNYDLYNCIKPEDMHAYFEKNDNKIRCTINKKSLKMKRDYYAKRSKESN